MFGKSKGEQKKPQKKRDPKIKYDRHGNQKLDKNGNPKKNRHIPRKVLLVLLVVLMAAIAFNAASCAISRSQPQVPHDYAAVRDAQVANSSSSGIAAYDILFENGAPDDLYVNDNAVGIGESSEDLSGQTQLWDEPYDGTDPFKIMSAYCVNCHSKEELGLWRGPEDRAYALVASMRDDFGCGKLTDEQVEVLTDFYTE